jgi:hypothetical protein
MAAPHLKTMKLPLEMLPVVGVRVRGGVKVRATPGSNPIKPLTALEAETL